LLSPPPPRTAINSWSELGLMKMEKE
jgi:hypothetical protein